MTRAQWISKNARDARERALETAAREGRFGVPIRTSLANLNGVRAYGVDRDARSGIAHPEEANKRSKQ